MRGREGHGFGERGGRQRGVYRIGTERGIKGEGREWKEEKTNNERNLLRKHAK